MVKNIEKLAEFGELKIMEDVLNLVDRIKTIVIEDNKGMGTLYSNQEAQKTQKKLRIKKAVAEYVILTERYKEEYNLNFDDISEFVKADLLKDRYDTGEFGL